MRCLVLSPTPTHPADAGNRQRMRALLSALKAFGHRVELALVEREAVDGAGLAAMRGAWDALHLIPHDRASERRSLGETHGLDDWFPPALEDEVRGLAARGPWDLVLVAYVFLSRALELFPEAGCRVLDAHDAFADRHRRLVALGLTPAFFHTTEAEEARGLARADLVLAIQDGERSELEERSAAPVLTLGHWPERAASLAEPEGPPRLGYLASANPLNARSLARLAAAADAEVRAALLVGGGVSASAPAGVEAAGPVAEPAGFLARCALVLNPQEGGTGLRIKTVEALAHGLPVIGTAEAFAGLPARAGCHAAPNAAAVAALARRWLDEPAYRAEVASESVRVARLYAAQVSRHRSVLRDAASLARARRRPRALLATDLPFWRESLGNHLRVASLVRAARPAMDVDLLHLGPPEEAREAAASPALRRLLGGRGRLLPAPAPRAAEPPAQTRPTPFERARLDPARLAAFEDAVAAGGHAVGIVEYLTLSYLRHARRRPPLLLLDIHDVMWLRAANFERFGRTHHLRIGAPEELEILDGFDGVLAIQPVEAGVIERALPGRSWHLPPSLPPFPAPDRAGPARRIAFLGGDSPMNRDGLCWFLDQVWPAVPGAELRVAGAVCGAVARPPPGVVLLGPVADPGAFLAGCDLAVNPVFHGGGLKIKTVDYLARGLPSVLSAEAAHGLGAGEGTAFLVARSRLEFVAHLRRLLSDSAHRRALGEGALRLARERFGPAPAEASFRAVAALCPPR